MKRVSRAVVILVLLTAAVLVLASPLDKWRKLNLASGALAGVGISYAWTQRKRKQQQELKELHELGEQISKLAKNLKNAKAEVLEHTWARFWRLRHHLYVDTPDGLRPFMPRWWQRVPTYPQVWQLLGVMWSARVRREIWSPVIAEDTADFRQAMKRYRTPFARRWIKFCFAVRTIVRVAQTLRAVGADRFFAWVSSLLSGVAAYWRGAK